MVVEDVNDDATAVAVFRVKSLTALSGMGAVLGEAVNAAMQMQPQGQFLRVLSGDAAFDEITHQAAKLQLRILSCQVEVNQVIQSLRILLCRMRISKAISALLVSCCTSSTA